MKNKEFTQDGSGQITGFKKNNQTELTKREQASIMLLQGLLANPKYLEGEKQFISLIDKSIRIADELLKKLEDKTSK